MTAPVYIPSKGRADCCLTAKALRGIGVPFRIIVEGQEAEGYAANGWGSELLVLPPEYTSGYEYCDGLGTGLPTGSGPARNFALEHARASGHRWQWTIDDNISAFHYRYRSERGRNAVTRFRSDKSNFLDVCASLFDSFENVLMGGLEYASFSFDAEQSMSANKRVFSCNCLRTDMPFRWRGRYNEDVILSLDILKGGYCTLLVKQFMCNKMTTQRMKGGNTDTVYRGGTRAKSEMACRVHSDCVRPAARTIRSGTREHHKIDYSRIDLARPVRKKGYVLLKLGRIGGWEVRDEG